MWLHSRQVMPSSTAGQPVAEGTLEQESPANAGQNGQKVGPLRRLSAFVDRKLCSALGRWAQHALPQLVRLLAALPTLTSEPACLLHRN